MSDIEQLVAARKWKQARLRIQEELITAPTDHWLWLTLSLTYYEQKQYDKAFQCGRRAVELAPHCALALWHYAGALFMAGRSSAAAAIWTIILETDLEEIAEGECGEGMDWALQLVNDVHYRMGRYYQSKGDVNNARRSFEKYLHNRAHGVNSIYDADKVKQYLGQLPAEATLA